MAGDLEDDLPIEPELDTEDDEEVLDPVGEPEDEEDDEVDAAPAKPAKEAREPESRRDRRIQRLEEERKRAVEDAERARRELAEAQRRLPVEDPRIEQERLALMSPEDRMQYNLDKALRDNQRQTQQVLFQMQQQNDKAAFDLKVKDDPVYRRFAPDVEREYQKVISQGRYAPREDILKYLVGQRALEKRGQPNPKAALSRKRNEAKPVNAKGDAPRRSGKFDLSTPEGRVAAFEAQYGDRPIGSF